jgi:hypothetical protein
MRSSIVTKLPLASLPTSLGTALRVGDLNVEDLRNMLRQGAVRFVVADVGMPLVWIAESECFSFWKREVQPHLAADTAVLKEFPDEYCYFASQWQDGGLPIVLLSKAH